MDQVRTPTELASMRAAADARLDDPSWTRYPDEVVRVQGIRSGLDWLEQHVQRGPSSGKARSADDLGEVRLELRHAVSQEEVERYRGDPAAATRHGAIGHVLAWHLRREFTEAPL